MAAEDGDRGSSNSGLMALLRRKFGPAPLWVYMLIGVLLLAWVIRRQQQKAAASKTNPNASDVSKTSAAAVFDQFALAYPMPVSVDNFINVKTEPANITVNNPPTYRTIHVAEGQNVDTILKQYGITFDQLSALNGGLAWPRITNANKNGYISNSNPMQNNDPSNRLVFPSAQEIKVPA